MSSLPLEWCSPPATLPLQIEVASATCVLVQPVHASFCAPMTRSFFGVQARSDSNTSQLSPLGPLIVVVAPQQLPFHNMVRNFKAYGRSSRALALRGPFLVLLTSFLIILQTPTFLGHCHALQLIAPLSSYVRWRICDHCRPYIKTTWWRISQ